MHFASVIESWKGRAWVILIALAMVALLIAVVVVVSRTFDLDELYGILD
jgi:hypothetical protein